MTRFYEPTNGTEKSRAVWLESPQRDTSARYLTCFDLTVDPDNRRRPQCAQFVDHTTGK